MKDSRHMNGDHKMWVLIIFTISLAMATMAGIIAWSNSRNDDIMKLALERGINPIVMKCTLEGWSNNPALAIICANATKDIKISEQDIKKSKLLLTGK